MVQMKGTLSQEVKMERSGQLLSGVLLPALPEDSDHLLLICLGSNVTLSESFTLTTLQKSFTVTPFPPSCYTLLLYSFIVLIFF